MMSSIIPLIEGAAEAIADHKGLKPFLIIEGLEQKPSHIAKLLTERGWEAELLEGFTYRFKGNGKVVEVKYEPTREEMAHAVIVADLIGKGRIQNFVPNYPFSLVESIMAQDLILDPATSSVVEVLKCLLLDQLPATAALWEIELILNSTPELYEIAVKL